MYFKCVVIAAAWTELKVVKIVNYYLKGQVCSFKGQSAQFCRQVIEKQYHSRCGRISVRRPL